MTHTTHNTIVNFIWGIADDVLRDVYVRGKYRDVILPMIVLRRLDCLLEPTKNEVLERHKWLNEQKIFEQYGALCAVSGYPFYNTSKYTLKRLLDEPEQIKENFENYLDGFSKNVQEIIAKFKLRNQIETLAEANILYPLIQKFVSAQINLSPGPVKTEQEAIIHEGLTNHGMGYVFEELIRRFNEENNEEAGEHFTPRDIIKLMANLIFLPIKNKIQSTTYLIYDDACGSGGMLTEAEAFIQSLAEQAGKKVAIELYGQEVNPETYAICQADMLIKGKNPANIKFGSTLSNDGFPRTQFDFMLTNPPYGKTWKVDQDAIFDGKKKEIIDSRFRMGLPRVSDGQLLFLVNMLAKMKTDTPLGSRIATVHNGSSLFTGEAGSGESNIRKWIIENDWLECIIALPLNMFYNTGIATYIWILSNYKKKTERKDKIQLIDASEWYDKMRKNLGNKGNMLSDSHIQQILDTYIDFRETEHSKIFYRDEFGYNRITVERPLRLAFQVTPERVKMLNTDTVGIVNIIRALFGNEVHKDFNKVKETFGSYIKEKDIKLAKSELSVVYDVFTRKDETAEPVVKKRIKDKIVYEPDPELRDYENVPLTEDIEEYFKREVLPYVPDAWVDYDKTIVGYEISFTKYFYKCQPLRSLEEIKEDIFSLEKETEGLLRRIVGDERALA